MLDRAGAGIGDRRSSRVRHERNAQALRKELVNLLGTVPFVMLTNGKKPRLNAETLEQLARLARVLRGDRLRAGENPERPERDVPHVPDRHANHIKRPRRQLLPGKAGRLHEDVVGPKIIQGIHAVFSSLSLRLPGPDGRG